MLTERPTRRMTLRQQLDHAPVLLDTDTTRLRGNQHEIVASIGKSLARAREPCGCALRDGQHDMADQADLQLAIDRVALTRSDVEPATREGPVAPLFEGRTVRQPRILMNENARRVRRIHYLTFSPPRRRRNLAAPAHQIARI